MNFGLCWLAFILWFVSSQDILRSLEDEEAADVAAREAKQKFYSLTQYREILATAPILADQGGTPLTLAGASAMDVTATIQEVIGSLRQVPTTSSVMWATQSLDYATIALVLLCILLWSPVHLCYDQGSEGRGHWCTSSEQ
jgi:hypothetical protein